MDIPEVNKQSANQQIARAAGTVMLAFVISNLVGVVRGIVIMDAFGTSHALDSFNAANRIAEMLFNLVAGGALGSAFIPAFTGFITREDRKGAWRLASGVVNLVLLVLVLVSILAWAFAPQIISDGLFVLVPESDPIQVELTVKLLRIMLPSVVLFGLSGLVMGMLNAHQIFLIPAIAPVMYSLGMIFGTLVLPEAWGIQRLAVGDDLWHIGAARSLGNPATGGGSCAWGVAAFISTDSQTVASERAQLSPYFGIERPCST